jgi:hypothetical protein
MQANLSEKDQALKEAASRYQGKFSNADTPTIEAGEGAASAQGTLSRMERAAKDQVDAAFEVARSKTASVPKEYATSLQSRAAEAAVDFDVAGMPRAQRVFDQLGEMIKEAGDTVDYNTVLERWRRRAVNAADGASSNEERKAIRKMIEGFDNGMAELIDRSLIAGDEAAIEAWSKARTLNSAYRDIFKDKGIVQALTDGTVGADGKFALNVGADDAAKVIFGRARLGATEGLAQDLTKLKGLLPQEQWNQLREEAFLRLLRTQETGGNRGQNLERLFSGDKFATEVDAAFKAAPEAMKVLFSKEEIEGIKAFRDVALYATNKIAGGVNWSNTAAALTNFMDKLASAGGPMGAMAQSTVSRFMRPIAEQFEAKRARDAVRGAAPKGTELIAPAISGVFFSGSATPAAEGKVKETLKLQ